MAEAFDRGDLRALRRGCQREASVDSTAIDQHGAGSALAVIAALLATGQVKVLTEGIKEAGAGVERERLRVAVDLETDLLDVWRCGARVLLCASYRGESGRRGDRGC